MIVFLAAVLLHELPETIMYDLLELDTALDRAGELLGEGVEVVVVAGLVSALGTPVQI